MKVYEFTRGAQTVGVNARSLLEAVQKMQAAGFDMNGWQIAGGV